MANTDSIQGISTLTVNGRVHPVARVATLCLFILFLLLIWFSARAGFSSLLTVYAERSGEQAAADAAVNLSPNDPDAHHARGAVLEVSDNLEAAISEYNQAVSLRPDDFGLWLSLARASELKGDVSGAIATARQAVTLAPYYAQPHWQLGNILVRAGQKDEGFKELRLAGASNPKMLPAIIDLAWQLSKGDVQFVKQAIQPQTPEAFLALAEYLMTRGAVTEAVAMFRAAGSEAVTEAGSTVVDERRRYLSELFTAGHFKDAYELWLTDHPTNSSDADSRLNDPGFELENNLDEPGFGWHTTGKASTVILSLEAANPRAGRYSLRVEFKGESDPSVPIISQLVLIEPHTHYQLHFAARNEGIVSGGLPQIVVVDAGSKNILGQTAGLAQPTNTWHEYVLDFTSPDNTTAIQINLQREGCSKSPCPIFGRLWLDSFSLQKL